MNLFNEKRIIYFLFLIIVYFTPFKVDHVKEGNLEMKKSLFAAALMSLLLAACGGQKPADAAASAASAASTAASAASAATTAASDAAASAASTAASAASTAASAASTAASAAGTAASAASK